MTDQPPPGGTLATIDAAWADLLAAIDTVPPHAQTTPGAIGDWSVVDLMHHLAAWDQATRTSANRPQPLSEAEIEAFNATTMSQPPEDPASARASLIAAHNALLATITPGLLAGDDTLSTCACGQEGIADHYASHAADLRTWHDAQN